MGVSPRRSMTTETHTSSNPDEVLRRSLLGFAGFLEAPFPPAVPPKKALTLFKQGLAAAKRRKHFVRYRESGKHANEIGKLLVHLFDAGLPGRDGVEQVCRFFEADEMICNACDDSDGIIGDVFTIAACDLLSWYGSHCADKEWLGDRIYALTRIDPFAVRDKILDRVSEYLPATILRKIVEHIRDEVKGAADKYEVRSLHHSVATLAAQLNDGPLYERAIRMTVGAPGEHDAVPHAFCVDIARVYFKSGDPVTALSWLDRIPEDDTFTAYEREPLHMEIQQHLGNRTETERIAWRIFRRSRSRESLEKLLRIIGPRDRDRIVDDEARSILRAPTLSFADAEFLITMGRVDHAERYILDHIQQCDGYAYPNVLQLAGAMESEGKFLVTSLLFRALLEAILERGISKYYTHGVRYLRKLDELAPKVRTWRGFATHDEFFQGIRTSHARKSAFWGRYSSPVSKRSR